MQFAHVRSVSKLHAGSSRREACGVSINAGYTPQTEVSRTWPLEVAAG